MKSDFARIFRYMTKEEQDHALMLGMRGMPEYQGNKLVVLMGREAWDDYYAYQDKMVEKYREYMELDKQNNKAQFPKPKSKYHR